MKPDELAAVKAENAERAKLLDDGNNKSEPPALSWREVDTIDALLAEVERLQAALKAADLVMFDAYSNAAKLWSSELEAMLLAGCQSSRAALAQRGEVRE